MRSNAGMADRGTSTCASRKSPPPVNTLVGWLVAHTPQSTTSLWRWNRYRVPKRRPTTIWRRGNTQKNIFNILSYYLFLRYGETLMRCGCPSVHMNGEHWYVQWEMAGVNDTLEQALSCFNTSLSTINPIRNALELNPGLRWETSDWLPEPWAGLFLTYLIPLSGTQCGYRTDKNHT